MEVIGKKTTELTQEEIRGIYSLFEEVFHKERRPEAFYEQYLNTSQGYSYHALAMEDEKIVGHNAYIPFQYLKDGEEPFMLVISVDAMIHESCRGKGAYRSMLRECERQAVADGCKIRVGFPNDNSYPVQINGFKYSDIGELSTYCLPVRVGTVKSALKVLNPLSLLFAKCMTGISKIGKGEKTYTTPYAKDRASFDQFRYKWFGGTYKTIELPSGAKAVYKTADYQGIEATFLIDVFPLSRKNFDAAVRGICQRETVSLLLYVGNLPFLPHSMIKIPKAVAPKRFHFVGKVLDPKYFTPADVLDINNWELNLSNYDLI